MRPRSGEPEEWRADIRRSFELLRSFRYEQTEPDRFYHRLAADDVGQLARYAALGGALVLDVGGGPGHPRAEFERRGAQYRLLDRDVTELYSRGHPGPAGCLADGLDLPVRTGAVDIAFSCNVVEHVAEPELLADEMLRVTRPGGTVYLHYTLWLSPNGGHEVAPYHLLFGGRRATERFSRRRGHPPKNEFGVSLFPHSAARMLRWADRTVERGQADLVVRRPTYHPRWADWIVTIPGLREIGTWNVLIVLRRRRRMVVGPSAAWSVAPKLTGERPVQGVTPDSILGIHAAGYRSIVERLGSGIVVDIGCGQGFESVGVRRDDRRLIGIDRDSATAAYASRRFGDHGLHVACMDAQQLGIAAGVVDWAFSSHLIEHFKQPEGHVAEAARILAPGGTAFFLTPNAPADFENPFHVHLFGPDELGALLSRHFGEVWVGGLAASPRARADLAKRRRRARRLLALDPLRIRNRIPHRWYVFAYVRLLPTAYRFLARRDSGGATGITSDDFFVTDAVDEATPVLFAIARFPLNGRGGTTT